MVRSRWPSYPDRQQRPRSLSDRLYVGSLMTCGALAGRWPYSRGGVGPTSEGALALLQRGGWSRSVSSSSSLKVCVSKSPVAPPGPILPVLIALND